MNPRSSITTRTKAQRACLPITIAGILTLPHSQAGTVTVETGISAGNPDILAYNMGHFAAGSNTHD